MIQIDQLTKNYGDFHLNISLAIPEGRITGLVGRNGAGKSTTIGLILGLIRPDSGCVRVFGRDACSLTPADRECMGVALSDSCFSSVLNPARIGRILSRMYRDFDPNDFYEKARKQGLPLDKPISKYSTGMKAKLRVLIAISHRARLLILDEPTAGLDVVARGEILDMLRDYMAEDEHRSILITSHISTDLESLCDDIYMIHEGSIVVHEETDILLGNYGILKVTPEVYETLDKQYLLSSREEAFGYTCFTNERQFYSENYPGIVIESGSIDDMIVMMAAGSGKEHL